MDLYLWTTLSWFNGFASSSEFSCMFDDDGNVDDDCVSVVEVELQEWGYKPHKDVDARREYASLTGNVLGFNCWNNENEI